MSGGSALDDVTEWQGFSKPERAAPLPTLPLVKDDEVEGSLRDGTAGRIRIGELVGEGGIGRVFSANQVAIGRRVAVKYPRAEGGAQTRMSVLSEAWAAGTLDHPNVVRVHALGLDDDGTPMVVMQYIEGSPWSELMTDPNHPMWRLHLAERSSAPGVSGLAQDVGLQEQATSAARLPDHVRMLMQVASAVQHAHNHNILHRDLKADNVMIGGLGKLAIIDWGTALSLIEAPESRLMFHEDAEGVTGTPFCMAPEMAAGEGKLLSPATDVYLMGGMLYELLAGVPPHNAAGPIEAMLLASKGHVPQYPSDASRALVKICRKALAPNPKDRHQTAAEFRADLMRYMRQRSARESLADAQEATTQLADLVTPDPAGSKSASSTSAASASKPGDNGDQAYQVHRAYTRAELGYQQALTTNVDRASIDIGIEQCRLLMTRYALGAGDLDQAAALLNRMQKAPPELREELERRRAKGIALDKALDSIEAAERVLSQRRSSQIVTGLVAGLVAGLIQIGVGLLERLEMFVPGPIHYASLMVATLLVLGGVLLVRHKRASLHNRRLIMGLMISLLAAAATWPIGDALGASVDAMLTLQCLAAAVFLGILGALLDPRMWWGAALALGFYAAAAAVPHLAHFWAAGVISSVVAVAVIAWRPPESPSSPPSSPRGGAL